MIDLSKKEKMVTKLILMVFLCYFLFMSESEFIWYRMINYYHGSHRRFNLMAPVDNKREIFRRHVIEAYDYAELIKNNFSEKICLHILDIGTGAGFPGLPLSILFKQHRFWLNDRKGSRLDFIKEFILKNSIDNINFLECDFSEISKRKEFLNFFDVITFRAVKRLNDIVDSIIPLMKDNGCIVCGKGHDWESEVAGVSDRIKICDFIHKDWGMVMLLKKYRTGF